MRLISCNFWASWRQMTEFCHRLFWKEYNLRGNAIDIELSHCSLQVLFRAPSIILTCIWIYHSSRAHFQTQTLFFLLHSILALSYLEGEFWFWWNIITYTVVSYINNTYNPYAKSFPYCDKLNGNSYVAKLSPIFYTYGNIYYMMRYTEIIA